MINENVRKSEKEVVIKSGKLKNRDRQRKTERRIEG